MDESQLLSRRSQDILEKASVFVLTSNTEGCPNALIEAMAGDGIATNVHYKPLPMLTAYQNMGFDIKDYPNALAQFENEITLPLYSTLTEDDVRWVCERLLAHLNG